jgi:hypothetical protein
MSYRPPPLAALRRLVDFSDPRSVASGFRRRRMAAFRAALLAQPGRVRVVDLGGTPEFWLTALPPESLARLSVTCVNLDPHPVPSGGPPGLELAVEYGDACDLRGVPDGAFDVAFSNSVLEHVGDWSRQRAFAAEARRVSRRYWVQMPSRHFPLEPHFLFPGFQYLPRPLRRGVARRWPFGWAAPGSAAALEAADTIRLLTAGEMRRLFPDGELRRERALGLTKSLVAVRG